MTTYDNITPETLNDAVAEENGCDCEPEGWVLLHKPLEEA